MLGTEDLTQNVVVVRLETYTIVCTRRSGMSGLGFDLCLMVQWFPNIFVLGTFQPLKNLKISCGFYLLIFIVLEIKEEKF